jgi:hypothetical protein
MNFSLPQIIHNGQEMNESTELKKEDLDEIMRRIIGGEFDMKKIKCWGCEKEFYNSRDGMNCDECFFKKFPKEQVENFYRSFLE